jgi:outer membrane protein assembly factor BamB
VTQKKAVLLWLVIAAAIIAWVAFMHLRGKDRGAVAATASGSRLKWQFKTDNNSAVTSIVLGADGTIYAGAKNGIYAIFPDGTRRWKTQLAGLLYLAGSEDGTIYLASSHGLIFSVLPNGTLSWNPKAGLIGFGGPPAVGRRPKRIRAVH